MKNVTMMSNTGLGKGGTCLPQLPTPSRLKLPNAVTPPKGWAAAKKRMDISLPMATALEGGEVDAGLVAELWRGKGEVKRPVPGTKVHRMLVGGDAKGPVPGTKVHRMLVGGDAPPASKLPRWRGQQQQQAFEPCKAVEPPRPRRIRAVTHQPEPSLRVDVHVVHNTSVDQPPTMSSSATSSSSSPLSTVPVTSPSRTARFQRTLIKMVMEQEGVQEPPPPSRKASLPDPHILRYFAEEGELTPALSVQSLPTELQREAQEGSTRKLLRRRGVSKRPGRRESESSEDSRACSADGKGRKVLPLKVQTKAERVRMRLSSIPPASPLELGQILAPSLPSPPKVQHLAPGKAQPTRRSDASLSPLPSPPPSIPNSPQPPSQRSDSFSSETQPSITSSLEQPDSTLSHRRSVSVTNQSPSTTTTRKAPLLPLTLPSPSSKSPCTAPATCTRRSQTFPDMFASIKPRIALFESMAEPRKVPSPLVVESLKLVDLGPSSPLVQDEGCGRRRVRAKTMGSSWLNLIPSDVVPKTTQGTCTSPRPTADTCTSPLPVVSTTSTSSQTETNTTSSSSQTDQETYLNRWAVVLAVLVLSVVVNAMVMAGYCYP